jgi:hypothetical protein
VYIVIATDGKEYGPVDLFALNDWIVQGRVVPETLIRDAESGRQCPAGEMLALYPVFHREVDPAPLPESTERTGAVARVPREVRLTPRTHPPAMAVILSLWLPGLGQFYNRQASKAVAILMLTLSICLLADIRIGLIMLPLAAIDAGLIAARLNRGEPVREWEWF